MHVKPYTDLYLYIVYILILPLKSYFWMHLSENRLCKHSSSREHPTVLFQKGSLLLSALRCARPPPLSMSKWKRPEALAEEFGFCFPRSDSSEQELMECRGIFTRCWLKASFQWGAVMAPDASSRECFVWV